jgi:hypothetical protein
VVGNNAQEIFKWDTWKVEIRIDLESEAVVVPGLMAG